MARTDDMRLIALLAALGVVLALVSLRLGPAPLSAGTVLQALLGRGDPIDILIVQELRLPRTLLALMIGASLALAGAALLPGRGQLTALSLGEDVARSSGVDLQRLQWMTLVGVASGVGACVAVAGVIGFVGLVVPHLVRPLVGHDPARVHVPAMLAGADLVLAADALSRLAPASGEIRIGVLTSLIGVPFFIWLVLRRRRAELFDAPGGLA